MSAVGSGDGDAGRGRGGGDGDAGRGKGDKGRKALSVEGVTLRPSSILRDSVPGPWLPSPSRSMALFQAQR